MNSGDTFGRSHLYPLVGRDAELETMRQFLFAATPGTHTRRTGQRSVSAIPLDTQRHPQCMVLMGEAGIGKTRLAEELSREAQGRNWAVLWSRVYAQESSIPYRLWIEVLRNVINAGLWQKQELDNRPLVSFRLATLLPELYEQLPSVIPPSLQSPGQEQQSLWEAVLAVFTAAGEHTPLLIVLDDIQWADSSSCELLAYLARRFSDQPIKLLATCRETELVPRHPLRSLLAHMHREHSVSTLPISPLSDAQIRAMLAHLPETAVQYISTHAAGNPFFAGELAYSLSSAPPTPGGNKQQALRKRRSALPDSITAALNHRLSKLSRSCQQLLGNAAILGGSFEFSLIRSMEASSPTPSDEDTVLDLLDEALQAGVLTEEGRGRQVSYRFWHPLLVSHLYDGLSATKRALLHRRAAATLRQLSIGREADGAATITHHLVEGGAEPQQIVHYAALAGDAAYALSAYPEAERFYRIAVEHIGASPGIPQNERLRLVHLLEQLGECLRIQGNYEEARHIYERVLDERSRQRNAVSAAEAMREAQINALLWSEAAWAWYYAGDYARTRQYCERGEQVLHNAGVASGPAWARLYYQQSYIFWQEGNYDAARRAAYKALHLFEEHLKQQHQNGNAVSLTRLRRTLDGDPVDLARTHRLLGSLANSVGQLTEALKHFTMALTILEQHDSQREVAHVCCNMGHVHLQKAEHELASSYLHRSLALAERIGDIPLTAVISSNLGELAARSGELAEAARSFQRSLAIAEQINDHVYMSTWNAALAAVLQDSGMLSEAGSCIRRALSISRAIHNAPCIGLALIASGNLRIEQALEARAMQAAEGKDQDAAGENLPSFTRCLLRAQQALERALTFDSLEADARNRGQLASARVSLLLGDVEKGRVQAAHALKKAQQYELTWLVSRAQSLLGSILAAQGQQEQADQYFNSALQTFRACDMRLEYARTLHNYAVVLLQRPNDPAPHQQALRSLQEARHIFDECHAVLDLQRVERLLANT